MMKIKREIESNSSQVYQNLVVELPMFIPLPDVIKSENEISSDTNGKPNSKSIDLAGDQLMLTANLPGVFFRGVQYYDLNNIPFINTADITNLTDLLRSLLKQGIEVQLVNANKKVQEKIRSMDLEGILNFC